MACALIAVSATEDKETKKTKRGILSGSPYNQLVQPSLSLGAGQVVQSYAAQPSLALAGTGGSLLSSSYGTGGSLLSSSYGAQPALSLGSGSVLSSYGGQQGLAYRSSFASAPLVQSYAAQPALSYANAAPLVQSYSTYAAQPALRYAAQPAVAIAAQPAISYAAQASPVIRTVGVQHIPQVVVREKYPGRFS